MRSCSIFLKINEGAWNWKKKTKFIFSLFLELFYYFPPNYQKYSFESKLRKIFNVEYFETLVVTLSLINEHKKYIINR